MNKTVVQNDDDPNTACIGFPYYLKQLIIMLLEDLLQDENNSLNGNVGLLINF